MAALLAAQMNAATVAVAMNLRIVIVGVSKGVSWPDFTPRRRSLVIPCDAAVRVSDVPSTRLIAKRWMRWSAGRWVAQRLIQVCY
jgi:hypothetical protein